MTLLLQSSAFMLFVAFLDLLQQDKKLGNVDPDTLHGAVERHVTFRIACVWGGSTTAKSSLEFAFELDEAIAAGFDMLGARKETQRDQTRSE